MKRIYKNLIIAKAKGLRLVILILFASGIISSCDMDVLNIAPADRFTEDAVWSDKALIEAFIGNTYRTIPSGLRYSLYGLSVVVDENNARSNSWAWSVWAGNLNPDDLREVDYWTGDNSRNINYWQPINRTNIFFENIDREREVEIDEATMNRMKGEMKVIRAYSYFKLISLFGGVPLITKTFSLDDDFKMQRNSFDEVMAFVLKELDEAIPLLPLEYDNPNKGRITKGAAMAVKSRALLYRASPLNNPQNDQQRWREAADAAKAIIDLGKYQLFPDYRTMFLEEQIYNNEMIWQRPYNQFDSPEAVYVELSLYPNGYNGFGQVHPLHNLVEDYETTNGLLPKDDPEYDPQNPYTNRDPRFYASILYDGAPFQGREVETFLPGGLDSNEGPVSAWNATQTGYYQLKFANEKIVNPSSNNMSQTPWTFFRYAEILLNYAEASYFLGDEATAREYINMVRSRESVNMPPVTESGEALFERIVNERRIELVFEEHRWFDIRRWKILPQVADEDLTRMIIRKNPDGTKQYEVAFWKEGNFNEANYLLPIPQSEINKNGMLEQNPGYN
ncbi:MAG TPA: RagB/SusD family nutrient uptake outer membrane protein [Cyclobacteriaceae bacterium]|nr:RagB/SusD family nutrient uptake outer membrane protein [Cyclobacteriaceae bacterium]